MSSSGSSAAPKKPATADLLDLVFNGDTSNPTTLPEAQYLPALQRQAELERQLAEQQEKLRLLQAQAHSQAQAQPQSQLVPPYPSGTNGFPLEMQPGFGGTGMGAPQMGYPAMTPSPMMMMMMQPGRPMLGTQQQWQQPSQQQSMQPPLIGMMMGPPPLAHGRGMGNPMAPMNNAMTPGMMGNMPNMPYPATGYAMHPMTASAQLENQEDLPSHPPPPPPSM